MIIKTTKIFTCINTFLFITNLKKSDGWVLVINIEGIKQWDKETKLTSEKKEERRKGNSIMGNKDDNFWYAQ